MSKAEKPNSGEQEAPKREMSKGPTSRERHKRFRVRPEAMGIDYETFSGWPSLGPAPAARPAAAATAAAATTEVVLGPQSQEPVATPESEHEILTEKEIARAAALRGIRTCLTLVACLAVLVYIRVRFGSFTAFVNWATERVPAPVSYEHPNRNSALRD